MIDGQKYQDETKLKKEAFTSQVHTFKQSNWFPCKHGGCCSRYMWTAVITPIDLRALAPSIPSGFLLSFFLVATVLRGEERSAERCRSRKKSCVGQSWWNCCWYLSGSRIHAGAQCCISSLIRKTIQWCTRRKTMVRLSRYVTQNNAEIVKLCLSSVPNKLNSICWQKWIFSGLSETTKSMNVWVR